MNLLDTLLGFARVEEDPVTEVLAWFLDGSPALRNAVLQLGDANVRATGAALPREADSSFATPTVSTHVTVSHPTSGKCRYDLALDWISPRVRLVIEVKVWAGLTTTLEADESGVAVMPVDQITRYLKTAEHEALAHGVRTHVVVLAPYAVEVPLAEPVSKTYAGQISWQAIHDVFLRVSAEDHVLDPTMRRLARDFAHSLEIRRMAAPKLTFDALTSVYRYRRFEQSITAMLTQARDALITAGSLPGFVKGDKRAWQDDHNRLGWRIWAASNDDKSFAFAGIYVGADTIHEEVPDLYFFVELARPSKAQQVSDAEAALIEKVLGELPSDSARWTYTPGGWQAIAARASLVDTARMADPTDAMSQWFRARADEFSNSGLLAMFLHARAAAG